MGKRTGAVLLALLPGLAADAAVLRVRCSPAGAEQPERVVVTATCDADQASRTVEAPVGEEALLDLEPGRTWTVVAGAPGRWAAPRSVWVGEQGGELSFTLLPTGTVRGVLRPPPSEPLPTLVTVTFASPPGGNGIESCTVTCPVGEGGTIACEVPAAALDLKLRAQGFASRFFWALSVPAGRAAELGAVPLVRGASVVGWVEAEGGSEIHQAARVRLEPVRRQAGTPLGDADRTAFRSLETRLDRRGFFQLEGVPAGSFVLVVEHPGFAPVRTPPLTLESGLEATLREPLLLRRPVVLEATVDPVVDPRQRAWRVELVAVERHSQVWKRIAAGEPDPESGLLLLADISPGSYLLRVRDQDGNLWLEESVEAEPGGPPIAVRIPVVAVDGRVLRGERPVAARLRFHQDGRMEQVTLSSDEEGRFAGSLPAAGTWLVEVALAGGGSVSRPSPVEVREPSDGGAAELEIRLPATRVEGVVVDEQGAAVARAAIRAVPAAVDLGLEVVSAVADGQGEFVLEGVSAGRVTMRAKTDELEGEPVEVEVLADATLRDVRLVVGRQKRLRGVVEGTSGPLPGAEVVVFPMPVPAGVNTLANDTTGADGAFEVVVPPTASEATVVVFAVGQPAAISRVTVPEEGAVRIAVAAVGGTLVVEWPAGDVSLPQGQLPGLVFGGGLPLPLGLFWRWAQSAPGGSWQAGRAVIPAMPAGPYRVLLPGSAGVISADGALPPYGELRLRLGG